MNICKDSYIEFAAIRIVKTKTNMQNLLKEQNSIKLVLGFFIASLIFLLFLGFSLLFSAKTHAADLSISVSREDSD